MSIINYHYTLLNVAEERLPRYVPVGVPLTRPFGRVCVAEVMNAIRVEQVKILETSTCSDK